MHGVETPIHLGEIFDLRIIESKIQLSAKIQYFTKMDKRVYQTFLF